MFQLRSIWLILVLFLFFYRAICMHDHSPTILSSISKLEEGLKTYGLLKSIREQPLIWEPVFVSGSAHNLTATAFLNELLVDFSLSDVKVSAPANFAHFIRYTDIQYKSIIYMLDHNIVLWSIRSKKKLKIIRLHHSKGVNLITPWGWHGKRKIQISQKPQ